MSLGEGDTEGALRTMTLAALSSPQNSDIYLNMGLILYQQERFEEAIPILERAVLINPYYANAKYFLALSYYEVGRRQDAILQFRDVATLNPDNTTVTEILENLEAGLSPLSGVENIESEE
jgi:tetratricopeptide (TPR) repeat protein